MSHTDSCSDPLDRLLSSLRTRVPGVTDAMLHQETANVVDEFFRRTNAWRYHAVFDLTEGEERYDLDPPENSVMVRVIRMESAGQPVRPYDADGEGGAGRGARGIIPADEFHDEVSPGTAVYYPDRTVIRDQGAGPVLRYAIYYPTYVTISLPSAEAAKHPMDMVLALSINLNASCDLFDFELPEWMYTAFFRDWLDGTQATLMSQISKPYSNPVMAEYHGRRFRSHMAFHKQEADRGFIYNAPRWRYPRGGFIV